MKALGPNEERVMQNFQAALADARTPNDMFPPDYPDAGDREPRNPVVPPLIGRDCLRLARVYDMEEARRNKVLGQSVRLLAEIDELVPA